MPNPSHNNTKNKTVTDPHSLNSNQNVEHIIISNVFVEIEVQQLRPQLEQWSTVEIIIVRKTTTTKPTHS